LAFLMLLLGVGIGDRCLSGQPTIAACAGDWG